MVTRSFFPGQRSLPIVLLFVFVSTAVLVGCSNVENTADDVQDAVDDAADNLPGVGEHVLHATLTGAAEVPGPGDPNGTGDADVTIDTEDGEVCYEIETTNIDPITAAHVHRGAAGESGGPVVTFNISGDGLDGCTTGVSRTLVQEIISSPAAFYVNVHNAAYPNGALRGQLAH
jgi:hypothetical protein